MVAVMLLLGSEQVVHWPGKEVGATMHPQQIGHHAYISYLSSCASSRPLHTDEHRHAKSYPAIQITVTAPKFRVFAVEKEPYSSETDALR